MNGSPIHGIRRCIPASVVRQTLGDSLARIRQSKRLTWVDLGEVLGKSEDQAAKYADGSAMMDAAAYTNARLAWGSEFTGDLDKLIRHDAPKQDGAQAQSCILRAALALSVALEDGDLSNAEIAANRSALEQSRDAITGLLARLGPKAASK